MQKKSVLGVIPARWASTRFEGKPLARIGGREVILHVCDQVKKAKNLDDFLVATDDERIFQTVVTSGYKAIMTRNDHPTGTDRLVEVSQQRTEDMVLNIQGDEPFINPGDLDMLIQTYFENGQDCVCATLASLIEHEDALTNPNVVKVVCDRHRKALYFSRSLIPFVRGKSPKVLLGKALKHIGVYLYQREWLLGFAKMPTSHLEEMESLEQLRILENGEKILVHTVKENSIGIDTPEDLKKAEMLYTNKLCQIASGLSGSSSNHPV